MKKTFRRGYLVNTAVLIAVYALCVALSVVLADSGSFRLTVVPSIWQCCYLIILAASLNLVLGFMGQLWLGHCGFMAIGAYTAALMSLAFQRAGVYDEKSGKWSNLAYMPSEAENGFMPDVPGEPVDMI